MRAPSCVYGVKEKFNKKCPAFNRQLRQALIDMKLDEALQHLDQLESAALADRTGIIHTPVCSAVFVRFLTDGQCSLFSVHAPAPPFSDEKASCTVLTVTRKTGDVQGRRLTFTVGYTEIKQGVQLWLYFNVSVNLTFVKTLMMQFCYFFCKNCHFFGL